VPEVFNDFEQHFQDSMMTMDFQKYFGIILIDGLSGAEEKTMDTIGDLTNIIFIGGSAGDDLKFTTTYLMADGKTYTDAAVVVLIKVADGTEFEFIKTQSFTSLPKTLVANKVNEENREVLEFNNQAAAAAYAEAIDATIADAPGHFMDHPLGLMIDEEPYVRSPQQFKGDSVIFYCNILEGMELNILESTNIIDDTREAIDATKNKLGDIAGIINFNCILRTLELEVKGLTDQYGLLFQEIPTIGFSTYGEEYIGHINQTATMLVIK
jgi:hypothetical protein